MYPAAHLFKITFTCSTKHSSVCLCNSNLLLMQRFLLNDIFFMSFFVQEVQLDLNIIMINNMLTCHFISWMLHVPPFHYQLLPYPLWCLQRLPAAPLCSQYYTIPLHIALHCFTKNKQTNKQRQHLKNTQLSFIRAHQCHFMLLIL